MNQFKCTGLILKKLLEGVKPDISVTDVMISPCCTNCTGKEQKKFWVWRAPSCHSSVKALIKYGLKKTINKQVFIKFYLVSTSSKDSRHKLHFLPQAWSNESNPLLINVFFSNLKLPSKKIKEQQQKQTNGVFLYFPLTHCLSKTLPGRQMCAWNDGWGDMVEAETDRQVRKQQKWHMREHRRCRDMEE